MKEASKSCKAIKELLLVYSLANSQCSFELVIVSANLTRAKQVYSGHSLIQKLSNFYGIKATKHLFEGKYKDPESNKGEGVWEWEYALPYEAYSSPMTILFNAFCINGRPMNPKNPVIRKIVSKINGIVKSSVIWYISLRVPSEYYDINIEPSKDDVQFTDYDLVMAKLELFLDRDLVLRNGKLCQSEKTKVETILPTNINYLPTPDTSFEIDNEMEDDQENAGANKQEKEQGTKTFQLYKSGRISASINDWKTMDVLFVQPSLALNSYGMDAKEASCFLIDQRTNKNNTGDAKIRKELDKMEKQEIKSNNKLENSSNCRIDQNTKPVYIEKPSDDLYETRLIAYSPIYNYAVTAVKPALPEKPNQQSGTCIRFPLESPLSSSSSSSFTNNLQISKKRCSKFLENFKSPMIDEKSKLKQSRGSFSTNSFTSVNRGGVLNLTFEEISKNKTIFDFYSRKRVQQNDEYHENKALKSKQIKVNNKNDGEKFFNIQKMPPKLQINDDDDKNNGLFNIQKWAMVANTRELRQQIETATTTTTTEFRDYTRLHAKACNITISLENFTKYRQVTKEAIIVRNDYKSNNNGQERAEIEKEKEELVDVVYKMLVSKVGIFKPIREIRRHDGEKWARIEFV